MLICKGEKSYKCSEIKTFTNPCSESMRFTITGPITHADVAELFGDDTFYFYDDLLQGIMPYTKDTKLVGLSITYNADSSCEIIIKLKKGVVDDES